MAAILAIIAMALCAPSAQATTTLQEIASPGPLTGIYLGNDLDCQVSYTGDISDEFYPPDTTDVTANTAATPGDCGTFVSIAGTLFGPDFSTNNGSATGFSGGSNGYTTLTAGAQSGVTGAGTPTSPFAVTSTDTAGTTGLKVSQTDSYVAGQEYYRTDITLSNTAGSPISGLLSHAGDCYLQGSDSGYGNFNAATNAVACTADPNNSPPGLVEEFAPLTAGSHYLETFYGSVWAAVAAQTDFPDTCDCTTDEDNGGGLNWDFDVPAGGSVTYSLLTNFSATGVLLGAPIGVSPPTISGVAGQGQVLTETNGTWLNSPTSYTYQWEDCDATGANCAAIAGANAQTYTLQASDVGDTVAVVETAINADGPGNAQTSAPTAVVVPATVPVVAAGAPVVTGTKGAAFSGTVDPGGLATVAHFEYVLDPRDTGASHVVYNLSTPPVNVGSDFAATPVSATAADLLPGAEYHVRLVATNALGTTVGPDATFTTKRDPLPGAPVVGKTANLTPLTGIVFIKVPAGHGPAITGDAESIMKGRGFIPLTETRQVPVGTQIDARRGTLRLVVAAARTGKRTRSATLGGGLFGFAQDRSPRSKGLTTFSLLEGAFHGAPTYSSCKASQHALNQIDPAHALPLKRGGKGTVIQTLDASDKGGHFATKGKYSAGTVRGTVWDTSDRCDGTLTAVKRGTVAVLDFHTRKTVLVHAGHSYLAAAVATHH